MEPTLIKVVFFGDSVTAGQYVDPALRWSSLIEHRLDEIYRESPVLIYAQNRGISGETTRMGLERFPTDVQNANPDILTLQYGLNDCNCWLTDHGVPRVSPGAFRENIVEMITRARRFGVKEIILSNNHPTLRYKTMISGQGYESANAEYSKIIKMVTEETGVTFCDIRQSFQEYSSRELAKLLMPYPDQLHLTIEGNKVYADAIWPIIKEKFKSVLQEKLKAEGK